MDRAKMAEGIRAFLEGLGERFPADDLERTPERVARAWAEDLISGYSVDPGSVLSWTAAPVDSGPVLVRRIRFASICVHHLLPFAGLAHVAYLPGSRLAGLSKIGRVVDAHARRLQTQEHLTRSIVDTLHEGLQARATLALLEAEHTCMSLRGVRKEQSRMTTVHAVGAWSEDAAARREMLGLFAGGSGGGVSG